jgi:hemoglobin-like flavoprotein
MNANQIALVQKSWELVLPIADQAAQLFYQRLFELDPSLWSLFADDMTEQRQKLMQMITVAVRSLDRLADIVPSVEALGARHVSYGVKDEHYATVGNALIWTLGQGLGAAFTPETQAAWIEVYTQLSSAMKQGARKQAA